MKEEDRIKELAQEKFNILEEERKFYETQCQNNEELTRQLDELNSRAVQQRAINQSQQNDTNNLRSEVRLIFIHYC